MCWSLRGEQMLNPKCDDRTGDAYFSKHLLLYELTLIQTTTIK